MAIKINNTFNNPKKVPPIIPIVTFLSLKKIDIITAINIAEEGTIIFEIFLSP